MKFRHEMKYEISYPDMLALRARLSAAAFTDAHARDGKYEIHRMFCGDRR